LNRGPPLPTLLPRAHSYSHLHQTRRQSAHKPAPTRKNSLASAPKPTHVLQSNLDFALWYDALEEDLLDASHDDYALYHEQLRLSQQHLHDITHNTTDALTVLSSLSDSFKAVDEQTTAFQAQCESLMAEQRRITQLADDMSHHAHYYAYLEPMTRRLNAPGAANLVRAKEFPDMLTNLDECLEYMQAHVCLTTPSSLLLLTSRLADPPRSSHLPFTLSSPIDPRPYSHSRPFYKLPKSPGRRCIATHLRPTSQRYDTDCNLVHEIPCRCS
jgi:hypothetical protein